MQTTPSPQPNGTLVIDDWDKACRTCNGTGNVSNELGEGRVSYQSCPACGGRRNAVVTLGPKP